MICNAGTPETHLKIIDYTFQVLWQNTPASYDFPTFNQNKLHDHTYSIFLLSVVYNEAKHQPMAIQENISITLHYLQIYHYIESLPQDCTMHNQK